MEFEEEMVQTTFDGMRIEIGVLVRRFRKMLADPEFTHQMRLTLMNDLNAAYRDIQDYAIVAYWKEHIDE